MGCCGEKRAAMRLTPSRSGTGRPPARPQSKAKAPPVAMRYLGGRPIRVRGVSGRVYLVPAPPNAPLLVDARDAPGLARTGYFAR